MPILSKRYLSSIIVLPALLVLGGCAAGDALDGEWAGTVVDSAGINVVTNPAGGLWRASEAWVPVEDLAVTDRSFPEVLFGEITDLAVDANGRILVLDAMARTYHAFGSDGAHLFTAGRPGGGPGELAAPVQVLVLPGDSVLVTDLGNSRAKGSSSPAVSIRRPIGSSGSKRRASCPTRWSIWPPRPGPPCPTAARSC